MDSNDAFAMTKERILKLAKNNFILWLVAIIFVFIAKSTSKDFLIVITLIILALMLIKSIKLSVLITKYFRFIYEIYGPHPNEKRNSTIASVANIGVLALVILLFLSQSSNWYIIPLILLSCFIFVMLGSSLSGKKDF